jgi:hypothetical protein
LRCWPPLRGGEPGALTQKVIRSNTGSVSQIRTTPDGAGALYTPQPEHPETSYDVAAAMKGIASLKRRRPSRAHDLVTRLLRDEWLRGPPP